MDTLILKAATRLLVALLLVVSVYLLLRGHNLPGGGFVGGLSAAIALILYALAHGWRAARAVTRIEPRAIAMIGVLIAVVSGLLAAFDDATFLTGLWAFPGGLPLGTPLLFDVGVYLAVFGGIMTLVFAIEREV